MSKSTEVVLRAEIEDLGHPGDVVEVAPGYARNYLFPQGLAYAATEGNKRRIEQEKKKYQEKLQAEKAEAEAFAAKLEGVTLEFRMMAGDEDQLYGSVSIADIASRLNQQGYDVERSQVRLDSPIKALGEYEVDLHLHPEVDVPIKLIVERELG